MPQPEALTLPSPGQRLGWLDAARGIGIVLVVVGHIIGGLRDAGLIERDGLGAALFHLIYSFHMPLFFWLAGSLVDQRLQHSQGRFIRASLVGVAWPYFLWCFTQSLVNYLASAYTNNQYPFDLARVISFLWEPAAQFWFLYSLFLLHATALLSQRFSRGLCLGVAIGVSLLGFEYKHSILAWTAQAAWAYYWGVYCAGQRVIKGESWLLRRPLLSAAVLLSGCALLSEILRQNGAYPGTNLLILPATVAGMLAVLLLSRWRGETLGWLQTLGRYSMGIYVLHVLVVAGIRIAFVKLLHIDSLILIVSCQLVLGIALPMACVWLARRWKINRLFGLG